MKKGTKVSWLAEGATIRGHGVTISDETEDGHIQVAVDGGVFEAIPIAYHMVIYCTVTWLTVESEAPAFPLATESVAKTAVLILTAFLLCLGTSSAQSDTNTTSVPGLLGSLGGNLGQVVTDVQGAFAGLDLKNASAGVVGVKVPAGYGAGIVLHNYVTNNPVQVGLGFFGAQEQKSDGSKDWAFYDATLNISISTQERIPLVGWPIDLKIESGPAFKIAGEGGGMLLEQSAAYGDLNFKIGSGVLTVGGGVIHCSDPHFNNSALPMVHLNYSW